MRFYHWVRALSLRFLDSGSQHFTSLIDLKHNRVLNLLVSLNFFALIFLNLFGTYASVIMLQRDFDRYIQYTLPFTILNFVHFVVAFSVMLIKNRYGSFKVTYFSTGIGSVVCVTMAIFLGEPVGPHVILFSLIPVFFFMYPYTCWPPVLIHLTIIIAGIAGCYASYALVQPAYPLPDDLAHLANLFCSALAFIFMIIYSVFNWREVGRTENLLQEEKDQTETLLNETIPKLTVAEAKFRHLVNDSPDLIFQMDEQGKLLSMNLASKFMLRYAPEEMIGASFFDFVADADGADKELRRNMARDQFRDFLAQSKARSLRTLLKTKNSSEGVDVQITLQKSLIEKQPEIVAKASVIEINIAQNFLRKERGSYEIGNDLLHAESLLQNITEKLVRYFPSSTLKTLRVGLREMVTNAIEHGNLGITFDQKTKLLDSGDYLEFLRARAKQSEYAGRHVRIDFLINDRIFLCRVRDCGAGFDHHAMLARTQADSQEMLTLEHGRGVNMARVVFDAVIYNDAGNEVILKKKVPRQILAEKIA